MRVATNIARAGIDWKINVDTSSITIRSILFTNVLIPADWILFDPFCALDSYKLIHVFFCLFASATNNQFANDE